MVTWRDYARMICILVAGAVGIVGIFYAEYQDRRIEELTQINKRLLAESEALKEYSRKMTQESEEYIERVKNSEQVLREEATWADCVVPESVSACVCDSGKESSKPSSGTLHPIEDLH